MNQILPDGFRYAFLLENPVALPVIKSFTWNRNGKWSLYGAAQLL